MSENPSEFKNKVDFQEVQKFVFSYIKIIGFSFIFPIWIATFINEGTAIWKIFTWAKNDIMFWEIKPYFTWTLIIFLMPLIYILWFYYLTVKKVLTKAYHDFFKKWTTELSQYFAQLTIQQYAINKEGKGKVNLDRIVMWTNEKISSLPKWLQWITRRLFDQIPYAELINAYDFKDLEEGNEEKIASDINKKLEEIQLEIIDSIVPWWTKFIIPVNILLLIFYIQY